MKRYWPALVMWAITAQAPASDVTWTALGHDENDSMPVGNGDLAANVWTEQSGDLVLLVSKSDAWTELHKLVKLGRVRLHLSPTPKYPGPVVTPRIWVRPDR